ncbi:hypothetical protein RJ640_026439, partial [Escallonia rubra]
FAPYIQVEYIAVMPRKPTRRGLLQNPPPSTFSRFARSQALIASAYRSKRKINKSKFYKKSRSNFSGNGFENHASDENSEQAESSDEDFDGVVQADFAFFDPKPSDFHGVKILLQTYLDEKQWDVSGFADLILGQTTVGTVIKVEDDEDDGVYSVVTALNLGRYKARNNFCTISLTVAAATLLPITCCNGVDHKCIAEIKEFLRKSCKEEDTMNNLRSYLGEQAQDVGLLISQRVVNLPPQLLPPMYDALFDEVSWATEDEPTEELRNSFCFKYYLLISRIYKHKTADQQKRQKSDEAIVYVKPEDEIFHKVPVCCFYRPLTELSHSSASDSFNLHLSSAPGPSVSICALSNLYLMRQEMLKDYRLMGLVMAVEASKVSAFRGQLKSLIDEPS